MNLPKKVALVVSLLLLLLVSYLVTVTAAEACSTCGCSELCAIGMLQEDTAESGKNKSLLSESIWGNIILKMAYKRDAKLQALASKIGLADNVTNLGVLAVSGGVLSQVVVNQATLNPPAGQSDSYLPGSVGLGFSGLTNVVFAGQNIFHWAVRKKIIARQREITKAVESVLEHMEYSETECPEAQKQLAELIGERAARDCEKLWRSSHVMASLPGTEMGTENGTVIGAQPAVTAPETTVSISLAKDITSH
jgi:hypothetical protein